MSSCARVPTTISESAVATRSQIDTSVAMSASPSQSTASAQVSVIDQSRGKRKMPARPPSSERNVVFHVVELARRLLGGGLGLAGLALGGLALGALPRRLARLARLAG